MLKKDILTGEDVVDIRKQILAMEECACQGLQAAQALTDNSFVIEDFSAVIPALVKMSEEEKSLYDLANSSIATSLGRPEPASADQATKILPTVVGVTITTAQEDFKDKLVAFTKSINKIASDVSYKLQKSILWLTTHQSAVVKHLKQISSESSGRVRDTTAIIKGWYFKGKEVKNVDDAIEAAEYFLKEQLPVLKEYCEHAIFITDEALDVVDDVLDKKIDEHRLNRLYKAHTASNVQRILGGTEIDVLGGRTVTVSEQDSRAKTINEKILAVMSVQVNFDNNGNSGESHNTPSATEEQLGRILKIANEIMDAVDITEPKNPIGVLKRSNEHFQGLTDNIQEYLDEEKYKNRSDEDDINFQELVDASRMLSGLRLQATNFSVSTYTSATDVVEKLLTLIKLKD